jgi:hypothetical protein
MMQTTQAKQAKQATAQRRTVQFYRAIARAVTPAVLIAGLLVLAVYHFHGVLQITQASDNLYRGIYAFSQDKFEVDFQRDAGLDRPDILYDRFELMSFSDWDTVISVDGHTQELWNSYHGYSVDTQKRQVFASASGYGWQLTEVVTLVDDHTVTVTYQLTARHLGTAAPQQVMLQVVHQHAGYLDNGPPQPKSVFWYDPKVQGNTFTGEELPLAAQDPVAHPATGPTYTAYPFGVTTLQISGPFVASTPITLHNYGSAVVQGGQSEAWAGSLATHYAISNPPVDTLTTLGTETISFGLLGQNAGTPVILPLPQPATAPTPAPVESY